MVGIVLGGCLKKVDFELFPVQQQAVQVVVRGLGTRNDVMIEHDREKAE